MENQEPKHQRRVRYKGTHPRTYKEKYKELQPEKYADTIEKVIRKGGTPAGIFFRYSRDSRVWMPPWDMADTVPKCWNVCSRRDISTLWM